MYDLIIIGSGPAGMTAGIYAVRREMKTLIISKEVGGQMITPPNLYVFDTCQRFIYEMEHYRWDDWSGKNKDNKNPREKPVDKDDHEIECAGRSLLRLPKLGFRPPVQNQIVSKRKVNLDPYS